MENFRLEVEPTVLLRIQGCGGNVDIGGHKEAVLEVEANDQFERYVHRDENMVTISGYPRNLDIMLPKQASVELNGIGGDVNVHSVAATHHAEGSSAKLVAHSVGGDVSVVDVPRVELGSVGGDAEIQGRADTVAIGNVGGDLQIDMVGQLAIQAVGGDVEIQSHADTVEIGNVSGDLQIAKVDQLTIQAVGGDAQLGSVRRLNGLGHIGGNLELKWSGEANGDLRGIVGGDVSMALSQSAAFTLTAVVGGDVEGHGEGWGHEGGSGAHELTFGEGGPRLYLSVGGDLEIDGGPAPQRVSRSEQGHEWQHHPSMDAFGEEMRGLGRELEEMGRNLARELNNLGRDIAREVRVAGRETMRGMDFRSRERGPRGRGSFGGHDFNFDPEHIERIKREARAAAASGIARAQEAVERALQHRQPPAPPRRPAAPRAPTPPMNPPVGNVYTGQTIRMEAEQPADAPNPPQAPDLDAERLAILRMVHEGRLGPDEAEILLRGLEDRS